jgi:hypothetical protein
MMARLYKEGSQTFKKPDEVSVQRALNLERERVRIKKEISALKQKLRGISFELTQIELISKYGYYVGKCPKCSHSVYIDARKDRVVGHIDKNGNSVNVCEVHGYHHDEKCGCEYKGDEKNE